MSGEQNKTLVRQILEDMDQNWGSLDVVDKWFTPDLQLHFNGVDMDLAAYKEMLPVVFSAFSTMRHEIHLLTAEGDLVTAVVTAHVKHTGEWEGIAATDRTVSVPDTAVIRLRDGKIAEEWVVMDSGSLKQQIETSSGE